MFRLQHVVVSSLVCAVLSVTTARAQSPAGVPPPADPDERLVLCWYMVCFGNSVERYKQEIELAQRHGIRTMGMLGERVVRSLRGQLYRALHRLSLNYYDHEHTGRIMARVTSDTRQVQNFVVQGMQQLVISGLMVVGIMVILPGVNVLLRERR